jgi:hypothetical protein
MIHFLLFILSLLSPSLSLPPPTISEVFYSTINLYIQDQNTNSSGTGLWVSDQPSGKTAEIYKLQEQTDEHLFRYDLHKSYALEGNANCDESDLDGTAPLVWGWLVNATYASKVINGHTYDTWSLELGYAMNLLAVDGNGNPSWYVRSGPQRTIQIQFLTWTTTITDPTVFNVPSSCSSAGSVSTRAVMVCVERATMVSRAEDWVTHHVPYNQGATYGGYREDCSGYVSMCWETKKPGYTTFTMPSISAKITKADLKEGDVLLCESEHVVFFGGWSDAGHTNYVAYEETRPGEGTVKRVTPYPYWYNTGCFIPHRYNAVC